ncbi:unnamed protein product [Penicillium salamii]|uniref:Uncharacterized protein n=1 Tax=Penicillium salamii TaxID=1612424 RepID=A0A9W4NTX8_9EURO|nr:unnamed protein product [Penicillium salamii]CAG8027586.1 unnamed protein product [Penicillium salamii]CAG8056054.1 unnamed protein product [Penicillium salamii]CAG8134060.1 unnamed protein product [Penicillium salamii]CAG8175715.1 unnamed protein product [Penicillium salamii]
MAQPTAKSEAGTSEATPQTMNLTDRTASRQRAPSIQSDSDPTSSSGSSSEDSESESEDEQQSDRELNGTGNSTTQTNSDSLPHIGGRPKPRIRRFKGGSGLMSRLNAFLPQMKTANEDLQRQIDAGNAGDLVLDNAEANGERYIEMDLGLGVLEEKRDGESSSEESDAEGGKDVEDDSDIIGKLMGGKKNKSESDKPSIQEMTD